MIDFDRPVAASVTAAILDTLEPFREELRIGDVRIAPDETYSGDPVIRVRLEFRLDDAESKFAMIHRIDDELRAAVRLAGDRRFVLLDHAFAVPANTSRVDTSGAQ